MSERLDIKLILNLEILLNHEPSGRFGVEERLFLKKRAGESMQHVVMKLLGWMLYWEPRLIIEASADQHYKPDAVSLDDYGDPITWLDAGSTSIKKLEKITQQNLETHFVIIKATPGEIRAYERQSSLRIPFERVDYISFEDRYVDELAAVLHNRHRLVVTVPELANHLFVEVDGVVRNADVFRLRESGAKNADDDM